VHMDNDGEGQNALVNSRSGSVITPQRGVVTLFGYGIRVRVDRGHLMLEDGIAADRRHARFPRVGHGLKRLVVIGSDGMVSLAALSWLADQNAAFVMLDRDGSVLTTTGPVRPSDARLRRSQALASQSGIALVIARQLIDIKLAGQQRVARHKLLATTTADTISRHRAELASADSPESIRQIESLAAGAYWAAWGTLPINFPRKDEPRVPDHWRVFRARVSPLTGSPRLAANPPNAILNYLYTLLESESRLAAAALGLDPGIGMLHVDTPARDSLACDLMEPVRPQVDAFLVDWITREPLKREWFFEQRDGNCRLMGSFAALLSETAPTWGRAVAPFAEWVAQTLWNTTSKLKRERAPATRLTERHRSEAQGGVYTPATKPVPRPQRICRSCGVPLKHGRSHCAACAGPESSKRMLEIARLGRIATHSPKAEALRAATRRRHAAALKAWQPSEHPGWLTEDVYLKQIQPALRDSTVSAIASALGVSLPYATDIRAGRRRPHPRHWQALAGLVGVTPNT
jgi:CRISPR-associated endonuclease Cas1